MKPAFACQLAGVLKHVRGHGQVVYRTVTYISKFQCDELMEASLASMIKCATFGTIHDLYFTSGGSLARPASVILPSTIILRARSLFVLVQLDFGLRGEKRRA